MIGYLKGQLLEKHPPQLLLDVGGVGYEIEAPVTTFYDLPDLGDEARLYIHQVIRDDAHLLFGFSARRQRDLFRSLLKISGVGPRMALAILSAFSAEQLVACVNAGDVAQLIRVPGVGRKTAQRLLIEMRDRLESGTDDGSVIGGAIGGEPPTPEQDAVSALTALGYKAIDASRVVKETAKEGRSAEEIIRLSLQSLSGQTR